MPKWPACFWVSNPESLAGYPCRPLGDYRQPEAVEKGTRDDRVAEVFDLDQRRDYLGDRHQAQSWTRRHAGIQPGGDALLW